MWGKNEQNIYPTLPNSSLYVIYPLKTVFDMRCREKLLSSGSLFTHEQYTTIEKSNVCKRNILYGTIKRNKWKITFKR